MGGSCGRVRLTTDRGLQGGVHGSSDGVSEVLAGSLVHVRALGFHVLGLHLVPGEVLGRVHQGKEIWMTEEKKGVVGIVTRKHLAVRHAASKDPSRYMMNGIHFREDGLVEATDGHMMLRVRAGSPEADGFPEGVGQVVENLRPFTCPTESAEKLRKVIPKGKRFPQLEGAVLVKDEADTVEFRTTDLETVDSVTARKLDGEFPKTDQVMPEGEPLVTVYLSGVLLERVIKAAKEMGGPKNLPLKFEIRDEGSPVVVSLKDEDGDVLTGLIMPVRP